MEELLDVSLGGTVDNRDLLDVALGGTEDNSRKSMHRGTKN